MNLNVFKNIPREPVGNAKAYRIHKIIAALLVLIALCTIILGSVIIVKQDHIIALLKKPNKVKETPQPITGKPGAYLPVFCSVAPKVAEDRRRDKSKLKVANFNAEWLFLSRGSGLKCPGSDCPWKVSKR
jgi:hypothetical protein